jgi:hypothetical protein
VGVIELDAKRLHLGARSAGTEHGSAQHESEIAAHLPEPSFPSNQISDVAQAIEGLLEAG